MVDASAVIRRTRLQAGLSQAELARRLDTTQPAIARLEASGSNPRIDTIVRAVAACGMELDIETRSPRASIDQTQISERLRMTPGERIKNFERSYANVRKIALAGARSRGELD